MVALNGMHPGRSHDIPLRDVARVTLPCKAFSINTEVDCSTFLIKYLDLTIGLIICVIKKGESFEEEITRGNNGWLFALKRAVYSKLKGSRQTRYVSLSDMVVIH